MSDCLCLGGLSLFNYSVVMDMVISSQKSDSGMFEHFEIQRALIQAWLDRNKCTESSDRNIDNSISECPWPWG